MRNDLLAFAFIAGLAAGILLSLLAMKLVERVTGEKS
jgi:hypothetical protein